MEVTDEILVLAQNVYDRAWMESHPLMNRTVPMKAALRAVFDSMEKPLGTIPAGALKVGDSFDIQHDITGRGDMISVITHKPVCVQPEPDGEGWIAHTDNKKPSLLRDNDMVMVEYSDGGRGNGFAKDVEWLSPHPECKPVRYRIIKEDIEPVFMPQFQHGTKCSFKGELKEKEYQAACNKFTEDKNICKQYEIHQPEKEKIPTLLEFRKTHPARDNYMLVMSEFDYISQYLDKYMMRKE